MRESVKKLKCGSGHDLNSSLCDLCVLCASVVNSFRRINHRRGTEDTEIAQRNQLRHPECNLAIEGDRPIAMSVHQDGSMKAKLLFLPALFVVAGCSLIWSPSATVKSFITASQEGDVDKMTQLFSSKTIRKIGLDKVRSNNQSFAELHQRAPVAAGSYRMENVAETSTPEGKRVSFLYENEAGTDSIGLVFDLSKEGSAWKIDSIGGPGLEESASLETPAHINPVLVPELPSLPSVQSSQQAETETKTTSKRPPISGGVLNGKAISLPKPPYPPIAKAAKASGTVAVQVVVDENGNVISANAMSGHPLLSRPPSQLRAAQSFHPPSCRVNQLK